MANKPNGSIVGADSGVVIERLADAGNAGDIDNGERGNAGDGGSDVIDGYELVDPGTATGTDTDTGSDDKPRKRRGRPPGSRNARSTAKAPKNLTGVEKLLLSVHSMGAMILHSPEIELSEDEARELTAAIQNVQQYYPIGLTDKQLAWANLFMVAAGIYGTRIVAAVRGNKKPEDKPRPVNPGLSVVTQNPAPENKTTEPDPTPKTHKFPNVVNPSQVFVSAPGVRDDSDAGEI